MARPPARRRRVALVAVLALALAAVVGVAVAADGGAAATGVRVEESMVRVGPEPDGSTVSLDVAVYTPAADTPGADDEGRRAAVLLAHGFGGSRADVVDQAEETAAQGYVVLAWTARGFGESGGRIHLDDPDYEVADASVLVDLVAGRDDVRLDGAGDPVVGIAGASYGGALALLTAGLDDRVDATVPAITWHDLGDAFFPQNALATAGGDTPGPGVFKQRWASLFVTGSLSAAIRPTGQPGAPPGAQAADGAGADPLCGRFAVDVCRLFQRTATTTRPGPGALERLRWSSPVSVLEDIEAPTLLVQGEQDSLFGLEQADATARGLAAAGTEVAVHWIDGGHDAGGATLAGDDLTEPALAWFDHHLRDGPDPGTAFELALPAARLGEGRPQRLEAPAYGSGGSRVLSLSGSTQTVLSPAGGEPSALTNLPGAGALLSQAAGLTGAGFGLAALPGQTAVFESEAIEEPVTVAGAPRVRLAVTSTARDATLFASAWVVAADGTAVLPRQLVAPLRLTGLRPGEPREVEVALPSSAYRLERGERVRVVVASTDSAYAVPQDQRLYGVGLAGDGLRLPTVDAVAIDEGSLVPLPLALATGALLLLAAGLAGWAGRGRRRGRAAGPDPDGSPLVVEGLVKEYADGFRAVDDVSWRADRGQVVGLLGPNGAGKTTTMRMLVGLIRADAGRVRVLGEPVFAGSAVLGRVGSLIEGPGFLPHLSGRDNLHAFWAATGRPAADSHLDEVLAVADLGSAADRPVRSYSQGMRQRLGIAQAMLGLPEVLLLDEPTNGLDPPQIRGLRGTLGRYAAGGRTVVVSSHLLAEVEQTCSHVVVMHRGRVVLTGVVADLLAGSSSTLLGVEGAAAVDRAARVLGELPGVSAVDVADAQEGRLRVEGDVSRPRLVAALVDAGVDVSAVDGRRHLEEVFMGLVGDDSAARPEARAAETRPTAVTP